MRNLPDGYIPTALSFMQDMSPAGVWSILIGLVVVGGVITYLGVKSDKAKSEKQG